MAKLETSAERYRRIKAERLAQAETTEFTGPSGMVWKLRQPDLSVFITSGLMPVEMATAVAKLKEDEPTITDEQVYERLDAKDKLRSIAFAAAIVRYCAVDPKIVDNPTAGDEIGPAEIEPDDFAAILAWAMQGGGQAEGLGTFPQQR